MESFIDYYATMIYIGRSYDWPVLNEAKWRTRELSSAPYSDGKWRWLLFDCNDFCMSEDLIGHNTLKFVNWESMIIDDSMIETIEEHFSSYEWFERETIIFRSCWANAKFRADFQNRILDIADECFADKKMSAFINEYKGEMYDPLSKSWSRFWGLNNTNDEEFEKDLESTQKFFEQRREVVNSWFN